MGSAAETPATAIQAASLYATPNALVPDYTRFRVGERLLLTGHSHQAWPDCGFAGQQQAWLDAAEMVDRKWERAFARADRLRAGWRELLDDPSGHITLGPNTHELVVRLISALPLRKRPQIVTTDGEFHTLRRQLDRLAEAGMEVVKVPAYPVADLATRLAAVVGDRTALVAVSHVLYRTAHIVPGLEIVAEICLRHGAELLVDAYHVLNAVPFSVAARGLENAFVVGGGYKYCQLGEGNCFLRSPRDCRMRPIVTGWFSEFSILTEPPSGIVTYGSGGARFDGATYDPTAHYRAAEVLDFFAHRGLTPALLREVSQHQIALLARTFDDLDLDPAVVERDRSVDLAGLGGFLSLRAPDADQISAGLAQRGVATDHRDDLLRFGPAPYLSDTQLVDAMRTLADVVAQ